MSAWGIPTQRTPDSRCGHRNCQWPPAAWASRALTSVFDLVAWRLSVGPARGPRRRPAATRGTGSPGADTWSGAVRVPGPVRRSLSPRPPESPINLPGPGPGDGGRTPGPVPALLRGSESAAASRGQTPIGRDGAGIGDFGVCAGAGARAPVLVSSAVRGARQFRFWHWHLELGGEPLKGPERAQVRRSSSA
jgi:hypothetical protein